MKDLNEYKNEIFKRSEAKIAESKNKRRKAGTLVIVIVAFVALGLFSALYINKGGNIKIDPPLPEQSTDSLDETVTTASVTAQPTETETLLKTEAHTTAGETKTSDVPHTTEIETQTATVARPTESETQTATVARPTESETQTATAAQTTESETQTATSAQTTESETQTATSAQNTESTVQTTESTDTSSLTGTSSTAPATQTTQNTETTHTTPSAAADDHIVVPFNENADLMETISANEPDIQTDIRSGAAKVTDFAARLFKECHAEKSENTLVSPVSVLSCLAMTANGASGETLAQMEMAFGLSASELNEFFAAYSHMMPQDAQNRYVLSNSVWFKTSDVLNVKKQFLQTISDYYKAEAFASPFDSDTVKDINDWVKQKTDGVIPKLFDGIDGRIEMILVNALSFQAEWDWVFHENAVHDGIFTLEDGTEKNVTMMDAEDIIYLEDEDSSGFIKYYKDQKYAFVAMLPDRGISLSEFINTLDGEKIADFINSKKGKGEATMPKFEIRYEKTLKAILQKMGITDAFEIDKADFNDMGGYKDESRNLYLSEVLHKTYISVAEKGTQAGAATADWLEAIVWHQVDLDRPFVYMLIDCQTNIPFMIGAATDIGE